MPPVEACDLVSYLVLQTSFITAKQFKAHKSLESYNQFVCGWIKDGKVWKKGGKLVVTSDMAQSVQSETKQQYHSNIWYRYRSGRITASKMKLVCHTNAACPSQSLIKQICYPKSFVFQSKQTKWGCSHEQVARKRYEDIMKKSHEDFQVADSGFVINPRWPFAGATPDGTVSCSCCGIGVV